MAIHYQWMVLIHFVDEVEGAPVCGQPERANWLWSAFPDDVTCSRCWPLVPEHRAAKKKPPADVAPVTEAR